MRLAKVVRGLRLEESVDDFEGYNEAECSLSASFTTQFLLGSWKGTGKLLNTQVSASLFLGSISLPNTSELLLQEGEGQLEHFFV